jgi:hypothetical protein
MQEYNPLAFLIRLASGHLNCYAATDITYFLTRSRGARGIGTAPVTLRSMQERGVLSAQGVSERLVAHPEIEALTKARG